MTERIICSAIWIDNGNQYEGHHPINIDNSGFVICGYRHHNCFTIMSLMTDHKLERIAMRNCAVQGFLTSKNRFVDRVLGATLAKNSGQIEDLQFSKRALFSEDLW